MSPSAAISSHGNSFQPNVAPVESHQCRWMECTEIFTDAEVLYEHITSTHIGRKSAGTLSLECKWFGCSSKASKRDHLTSHMRVHIDLKPHSCDVCSKRFKRVQDLKKHEKIHTEEHHREHKQSKAVTVPSSNASSNLKSSTPPLLSQDRQSHQPSHLSQPYGNWLPQGAHHPAYPTNYSQAPPFHYNPQNPHYPPLGLQHSRQDFDIAQLVAQQQSLNAAAAAGYPGGYGGAPMYPLNIPPGMQLYGPVPYPSHQEHQSHPYSMHAPHQPIPASYSQYSLPPAHHPSQLLKSPALNTLPTPANGPPANGPSLYPSLPPSYNFYPTIQVPQESPTSTLSPHSVHSASLSPAQSNSSGIKSEQSGEGMEHRRSFSGNAIAGTKRGFEEAGENFLGALRNKKFRDTDSLDTELDALTKFLITPDELLAPGHTPPQSHSSGSGSSPGSDYSPAEIESINELLLSLGQSLDSPPALGDSMPPSFIDSYHGFNPSKPHFPEPTFASVNPSPLYPSLTAFEPLASQPTRGGHFDQQNSYGGNNLLRLSKSNVAPTILPNETRVPNYRHVERLMKAAPLHSLRSTSMDLDSDALEHLEEEEFLSHSHHKQRYTTSLRSTSLDTVTSATSSSDSLSSISTHSIRPMPHNRSSGPRLPPIKIPSFSQSTTLPSIRSLVDLDRAVPARRDSLDTLASIATESIGGGGVYPVITSPTGSMASGMERLAKGVTELGVEEAMVSDDEEEELETPTAAVRNGSESVEGEADLPTRSKKLRMESPEAMDQDEEILEEVQRANLKIKVEKAKRLAVIKLLVVLVNELYRKKVRKELERVSSAGKKEVEGIEEVKEVKEEVSSPAAVQEVVV